MLLAASGLTVLAGATPASGYGPVLAALLLAGTGIGIGVAMAPATDSMMGSLPRAKASVGSAMNDTARLVGGAFGVAVLGSTISLVYRTHIAAAAAQLPARATGPASSSLQAALQIAQRLSAPRGTALETAARLAFTARPPGHAHHTAFLTSAHTTSSEAARRHPAPAASADTGRKCTQVAEAPAAVLVAGDCACTSWKTGGPWLSSARPTDTGHRWPGPGRRPCGGSQHREGETGSAARSRPSVSGSGETPGPSAIL